jgi:hypothetical protein
MKIYFLVVLMSFFVAFSYLPLRGEAKQSRSARWRANALPNG